jgi:virginiamycin B lyase
MEGFELTRGNRAYEHPRRRRRVIDGRVRTSLLLAVLVSVGLALPTSAPAFVFWTNNDGSIGRANLDGTGVDQSFITLEGAFPAGIAIDASHVYWTEFTAGAIGRANLDGTGVDRSFISAIGTFPSGLAVDGGHIYWTTGDTLGRANLDGTGVEPTFIPVGTPSLLNPQPEVTETRGPAVDGTHLYWGDMGAARIGRANLDGTGIEGSFIDFGFGLGQVQRPLDVAVDGGHLYWANLGDGAANGTIGRAGIDGTGLERSFITGVGTPVGVEVDGGHVYWTNGQTVAHGASVGRANLDGTGVEPSFIPQTSWGIASALAVDSSNDFSFGGLNRNTRTGSAIVTVDIFEAPGELRLAGTRTVTADDAAVLGADEAKNKLVIEPKGYVRRKLNRKGKAWLKAWVTYTPDGGGPHTKRRWIKLIKR